MISLIIPTYNRAGLTKQCVEQALKDRSDLEVIWIDDGSTDGVRDIMRGFNPEISVIKKDNVGVARSYNSGIKMSTGDWIALMDSDFLMPDNWLSAMKDYINKIPETDIIGILIDGFAKWEGGGWEGKTVNHNGIEIIECNRIMGFYAVSREFLNKVGNFNEDMGWYAPIDYEWQLRAKKLNPLAYYIPGYRIKHLGVNEWDTGEYRERKNEGLKNYSLKQIENKNI